jgi:hypothetical protein
MRKLKTIVKMSMLPAAIFASIVWLAVFVLIGLKMPNHNIGLITLTVVAGAMLAFPWVTLVLAIMKRIVSDDSVPKSHAAESHAPEH